MQSKIFPAFQDAMLREIFLNNIICTTIIESKSNFTIIIDKIKVFLTPSFPAKLAM